MNLNPENGHQFNVFCCSGLDLGLLLEPPGLVPGLELHVSPLEEVVVVEDLLDSGVPLGEGLGHAAELDPVEGDQLRTGAVESPEVDDAQPVPVERPVRGPAPGIGTWELATPGHGQAHRLQLLHLKPEVEGARSVD